MVNFWMGHTLDDTQRAYFKASAEGGLKETYMKFIPYLTIQKEADISESQEYLRIKQENQVLQAETARHIMGRSELQDLRSELEKLKESILENNALEEHFNRMYMEEKTTEKNSNVKPSAEYLINLNKIESDPAYKARYQKFRIDNFMKHEVFGNFQSLSEVEKLYKNEEENKSNLMKALNKFQNMKS